MIAAAVRELEYQPPGAARPEEMASVEYERPCWDQLEQKLLEWAQNPTTLEDDDFEPPTAEVLRRARRFIIVMRERSRMKHDLRLSRVSPDGAGGLSFEEVSGPQSLVFDFTPDGDEMSFFANGDLIETQSIVL